MGPRAPQATRAILEPPRGPSTGVHIFEIESGPAVNFRAAADGVDDFPEAVVQSGRGVVAAGVDVYGIVVDRGRIPEKYCRKRKNSSFRHVETVTSRHDLKYSSI